MRRTIVVIVTAAVVTMTGCSYPGDEEDRAAAREQQGVPTAPAPSQETTGQDRGTDKDETTTPSPDAPKVKLTPEDGEVMYLRAEQRFSPWLYRWTVTEDKTRAELRIYECTGQVKSEGTGSMAVDSNADGEFHKITWAGDAGPLEVAGSPSTTYRAAITDEYLVNITQEGKVDEHAVADHQAELAEYLGMCATAGKAAARFLL